MSEVECLPCGACCFGNVMHIRLMPSDLERLGALADASSIVDLHGGLPYLVMRDQHCAQLKVDGETFACGIYQQRPAVCRDLDRGSPSCGAERAQKYMSKPRLIVLSRRR
jgi:uncharacterized protein